MRNKQILLSGRAVVTNAANVPADRYTFLHLSDAEPNLGTANANGWVLVYDTETPGNRLWSKNLITAYDHANSAYGSQNTTGNYANSAFLKANSAYESQNVTGTYANNAYIHANAANLQANSAYESQNVTGTYANNAYTHANAANLQANSAYESQNVTGTYANNAYLHANAANLQANSAYESQNVTGTYANNAYLHANSAYESQNTTGVYANAAFLKANSAYQSQNVTGTYANNAYLHANSAYESQNTTGEYANAAFLKANSAYESQNVTGTYANNAYLHANSAYGSQNVTGTYANNAYLHANSAYESQNVTGTYANNAYLHANAAFDKANSAYDSQNVTSVYANTAFEYANSAGQYANAAFNYANSAYTHSNAAFVFANTRYSANGGEISGDVVITGNLTISGNVTTVSANTLSIQDNMIYLNDGSNVANPDLGFVGNYNDGTYQHAGLFRDATDGVWKFFDSYLPEPDASPYIDTSNSSFRIANLTANVITDVIWLRGYDPLDASNAAYAHANASYVSQNTTGQYANASFQHANDAFIQANSAYDAQNVTGTYANNAYTHANAANLQANSAYESQNVTGTYANNAYVHANSSYESQNTTGVYANAAFLKANSAYESQNVTGTYANNAYLHANSAYESQNVTGTYANAAFLQANSAYESQNVTGTYANNAYVHANSAYDSQNTTGSYANAAFLKANSAYESQNVTGTYANNAYLHANSAYGSQNTTGTYANAAFLKANSAYESQNVTGTYANNSYLHANSAYESQNVTGTYANSAYESQNTTGVYANAAYEHANAAFIKANAAVFSITTNVNELFSNTSSGNIRLGLATVNPNTGEWGSSSQVPVLTLDKFGRVVSAYNSEIVIPPGTYIYPNTGQLTTNANFGNVLIGLANVNSNIGYFGSEFAIPKINVDGYGRIVNVANVTVSIPQGTYIVNSNLITANSQTGNVVLGLQESGVVAGTYGGQNYTPVIEVDVYGRIIYANNVSTMGSGSGVVNTLSTIVRASYTATAGQTAFLTASSFEPGYVDVYINGLHLSPNDYGANGSLGQIIINNPVLLDGDVVDIQTATTYVVNSNTSYQKQTFIATSGQTTFSADYDPGNVNVYLNGLRLLDGTDYYANNGISVQFAIPLETNDVVEIEKIGKSEIFISNTTIATRNTITVTANGDTTFIVGGGYRIGFTDVYMNGIKLNVPGDVQAIDGNTITILTTTTEVGDIIEVNSLGPYYSLANAIPVTGGIVYGSLEVLQNVSANSANVGTLRFNDGTTMTTAASGSGSGITWKIATANTTANAGEGVLVDTTSANVHITLNASPMLGNTVRIVDMTGNFGINNCIVERNGQKIMGLDENLVISSNNAGIGLVFSNATHGWRLIENP